MKILEGIRATGRQKLRTAAENGDTVEITLYYLPAPQMWKIDILSGNFDLKGLRLSNSLNILVQYQNIISFGLAVLIRDGGEPFLINDFSSGRCLLSIITPDEVDSVEDFYQELRSEG